jgi:hypothetical protein
MLVVMIVLYIATKYYNCKLIFLVHAIYHVSFFH